MCNNRDIDICNKEIIIIKYIVKIKLAKKLYFFLTIMIIIFIRNIMNKKCQSLQILHWWSVIVKHLQYMDFIDFELEQVRMAFQKSVAYKLFENNLNRRRNKNI